MLEITRLQLITALEQVGIQPADGLLVHAALQFLGRPVGGIQIYFQALQDILESAPEGENSPSQSLTLNHGTLVVPTFNFGFARGEAFHPEQTQAVGMGNLAEYIRTLPGALRSPHPMQSLAAIGRHAADIAGRDTPSAFDPGSGFARLLELDFKLLLLGADIQAVSMLHYCEQRAEVPYRYWKNFTGQVYTSAGWQDKTCRMYGRDLELDPRIELYPVQAVLEERRQWHSVRVNYGQVAACRLRDFVQVVDEFLARDPWSLVTNRPDGTV